MQLELFARIRNKRPPSAAILLAHFSGSLGPLPPEITPLLTRSNGRRRIRSGRREEGRERRACPSSDAVLPDRCAICSASDLFGSPCAKPQGSSVLGGKADQKTCILESSMQVMLSFRVPAS